MKIRIAQPGRSEINLKGNRNVIIDARHADNWRALGILTVRVMYEKVHRFVLLRHPRG